MAGKNFKREITGDVTKDFLSTGQTADSVSGSPAENKTTDDKEGAPTGAKKKEGTKRKTTARKAAGKPVKKETTETTPTTASTQGIPAGYVLKKEPKSDRLQVLIAPSIKAELKNRAKADNISVNELVNRLIESGLREG